MKPEMEPAVTTCGNCHSPMPRELRFCRNCGYRLGEGTAEYTETVRFPNAPGGAVPGNSSGAYSPLAGNAAMSAYPAGKMKKRKRRLSGMTWMFIILLVFFVGASVFTAIIKQRGGGMPAGFSTPAAPRSVVGVDEFDTADEGGVTFEAIETPGGPADLAGLVGGDRITSIDGQTITDDDHIRNVLRSMPIGKTVDVVYVRDGETKTTKLTTISRDEALRLEKEFEDRPVGLGLFGYEQNDSERVPVEGTNLHGVRLDDILPSRPADMFGIKEGDIVIEFDGVPIRTPKELLFRIRKAIPYSNVTVVVMRGGEKVEVPMKMGKG